MTEKLSERMSHELVSANKIGDSDLADLLREAAKIIKAWEDAPVARYGRSWSEAIGETYEDVMKMGDLINGRVKLLRVE